MQVGVEAPSRCWCSSCIPGREPGGVGAEPTHLTISYRLRGQTAESSACRAENSGGSTRLSRHFCGKGVGSRPSLINSATCVRFALPRPISPSRVSRTTTRTISNGRHGEVVEPRDCNPRLTRCESGVCLHLPGRNRPRRRSDLPLQVFSRQRIESDSPRWYRGKDGAHPSGGSTLRHWCQQRAWLSSKQRGRVQVSHAAPFSFSN